MISDEKILERHAIGARPRARMELIIVNALLKLLSEKGYSIEVEEYEGEATPDIKDACFNLDEVHLLLTKDGEKAGWIFLVMGNNGFDLISDYTTNLEKLLKPIFEISDKLENGLL